MHPEITLIKYADDTTILVEVPRDLPDNSNLALDQFFEWTENNSMSCNTAKCKELVLRKKGNKSVYPVISNIKRHNSIKLLGVTLQENSKFSVHIKSKLSEANKCLYAIRSLRKEGFTQDEVDHLFNAIVMPKIIYGLPVYGASPPDLNIVQQFLSRCYKRRYISRYYNIYELLKHHDQRLFDKIIVDRHPLHKFLTPYSEYSKHRLRSKYTSKPIINTERFKNSYFNRLIFRYNLGV